VVGHPQFQDPVAGPKVARPAAAAKPAPVRRADAVPTLDEESAQWAAGFRAVAGIDEVGRGPLAGPVVAGAVVLCEPGDGRDWYAELRDSKLLTAHQRERLAGRIVAEAVAWGIGLTSPQDIDGLGIVRANRRAMALAVAQLQVPADCLLFDGREWLALPLPQRAIVKGDRLVCSIAAASIIAKVHRDRLMEEAEAQYPGWGFGRHKGYATAEHFAALRRLGASPIHRQSFAPVSGLGQAALPGLA